MVKGGISLQGQKELAALLRTLPDRVEALKREVTSQLATQFLDSLQSTAPQAGLGSYVKAMTIAQVQDADDPAFAAVYEAQAFPIAGMDTERTVLYVKSSGQPRDPVYQVLARFHPFDIALFPVDLPSAKAFFIARTVSPAEVDDTRARNARERGALDKALRKAGVTPAERPFKIKEALAYTDAAFLVLRKELGLGIAKKPHWRPAIRRLGAGAALQGIVSSKTVHRLFQPGYHGQKKLAMLSEKVTTAELQSIRKFQEQILG